jgi:PIN domain nuclease of toxin-antitoxin system
MRLLLDSHVLLWWDASDERLPQNARSMIADPANEVLVSAASIWEIAIKNALGKIKVSGRLADVAAANGFRSLPIEASHAERAAGLPPHHRDPFDRMLVAQAFDEGCTLVTHDQRLALYGAPLVLV